MSLILSKFPEFQDAWQSHLRFWEGEEAGICNDMNEFSSFIIDNLNKISTRKKQKIFQFIEYLLINGDSDVQNAVTTCFLENLLNAASSKNISASNFVDLLGEKSRLYCKSWDNFTGVKTPGL